MRERLAPIVIEPARLQAERTGAQQTQVAGQVTPAAPGQRSEYTEDYRVGQMGETVSIYVGGDHLYFRQHFSLPIELRAEAQDQFFHIFHDGSQLKISFERGGRAIPWGDGPWPPSAPSQSPP